MHFVYNFFRLLGPQILDINVASDHAHWWWYSLIHANRLHSRSFDRVPEGAIDLAGTEWENVLSFTENMSYLWLIYSCLCGESAHGGTEGRRDMDLRFGLDEWTPEQLNRLSGNIPGGVDTKKNGKKCRTCNSNFNYERAGVHDSTMFVEFMIPSHGLYPEDFPETLRFFDLRNPSEEVIFELGYFSVRVRMTDSDVVNHLLGHQTSIHNINGQFRYYDSKKNGGKLSNVPTDLYQDYELFRVFYFRKF